MRRVMAIVVLVATACTAAPSTGSDVPAPSTSLADEAAPTATDPGPVQSSAFPPPPPVPAGPLDDDVAAALDSAWADYPDFSEGDMAVLAASGDPRLGWLLADALRFLPAGEAASLTRSALFELTGVEVLTASGWVEAMDHLIAWDVPAPPGYVDYKRRVYTAADERWASFFTDDSALDYRLVTWGGVFIDDRPPGGEVPCQGCIPGLDEPAAVDAADGDWYPDDRPVLGVVVGGEARAYPRNIMEVHELVNDSLGGRDFALPYCTLCGSGQLYFTDDLPEPFERPYLRTSGLLSRSNKIMYDVVSGSIFDTFTGEAVAGPMWEAGIRLDQGTVVTTTWGQWRAEYPGTTIVELDGGMGRTYALDPLGGRDAGGPIFPVGERDDRLAASTPVLGVVDGDAGTVAFPVDAARSELEAGRTVRSGAVEVVLDAGGLAATVAGEPAPSHQAYWFAWSQFHPDTVLWEP